MTIWGARFPLEDQFKGSDADRVYARYQWMARWVTGPSVLDFGCSHGSLVRFIEDKNIERYLGVDINPKALRFANAHYKRPWTEFAREIPEGEYFSTIVLGEVLEHQENPGYLLGLVADHAAHNTRFIITVPHGPDEVSDHRQVFSSTKFRDLMVRYSLGTIELAFQYERILSVSSMCREDVEWGDRKEIEQNLMDKHARMCRSYRLLERNYEAVTGVLWLKKLRNLLKRRGF